MTTALATRRALSATFVRVDEYSDLEGRPHLRALLSSVTTEDGTAYPFAWAAWGKQMSDLGVQPGDRVALTAEVVNGRRAVTLRQPRGMRKVKEGDR